jgi:hypothetical protein
MKVKCQVFTAAGVNVTALWDIASCIIEDDRDSIIRAMSIITQIKSRRIRWAGRVRRMGEERKLSKVLVVKPEGKRTLGKPRRRCKYGIKIDRKEIGLGCVEWIQLAKGRKRWRAVVDMVLRLWDMESRN